MSTPRRFNRYYLLYGILAVGGLYLAHVMEWV